MPLVLTSAETPVNLPFDRLPTRTPDAVKLMQSSRLPTRDCALVACESAVLALFCAFCVSTLVENFTSRLLLFWVIFDEISCVTPVFVAYVLATVLVMLAFAAVMSDFVASPEPSEP